MRKLLTLLAFLLIAGTAHTQSIKWGITGRVGAFTTLERTEQDVGYDDSAKRLGLQSGVGLWASKPISGKGSIQVTLLQTIERQNTGNIALVDADGISVAELKVVDLNFALNGSAVYLQQVSETWSVGTGIGGLYEYFSQARVNSELSTQNPNVKVDFSKKYENHYRRDFRLYLPLEAQYKLTERVAIVGQVQAQLSNLIGPKETSFKENDLGRWLGVNFTF